MTFPKCIILKGLLTLILTGLFVICSIPVWAQSNFYASFGMGFPGAFMYGSPTGQFSASTSMPWWGYAYSYVPNLDPPQTFMSQSQVLELARYGEAKRLAWEEMKKQQALAQLSTERRVHKQEPEIEPSLPSITMDKPLEALEVVPKRDIPPVRAIRAP